MAEQASYKGLIAGLGNPGPEYALTRHNAGFMVADAVLREISRKHYRRADKLPTDFDCDLWAVTLPRVKGLFLLAKPLTYMNLSGRAVARICRENGVKALDVVVVHDEMDLPLGRIKVKRGGGTAGHNGLESIVEELGTADFTRMRIGIGRPEESRDVRDYVLTGFPADEAEVLPKVLAKARDALPVLFGRGLADAQQMLHTFDAAGAES